MINLLMKEGKDINMIYLFFVCFLYFIFLKKYIMRTINPKCRNEDSFKYSILISLHYYDLNEHKERINQLNKYIDKYNFTSNN